MAQNAHRRGFAALEVLLVALFFAMLTAVVLHQVYKRQLAQVVATAAA